MFRCIQHNIYLLGILIEFIFAVIEVKILKGILMSEDNQISVDMSQIILDRSCIIPSLSSHKTIISILVRIY